MDDVTSSQIGICRKFGADYLACHLNIKIGISKDFDPTKYPLNGIRHPPEGDTTWWYIWSGKGFSDKSDFFVPLHAAHLPNKADVIVKYLGLAPGWRFLVAPGHEDIWEHQSLLTTR
jgi:hypothetical protein